MVFGLLWGCLCQEADEVVSIAVGEYEEDKAAPLVTAEYEEDNGPIKGLAMVSHAEEAPDAAQKVEDVWSTSLKETVDRANPPLESAEITVLPEGEPAPKSPRSGEQQKTPAVVVQNAEVWEWGWSNATFADHMSLGLNLCGKRHVIVTAVRKGGLAHDWNETNKDTPGAHMIVKGAVIVGVNEVRDHETGHSVNLLRAALQSSALLHIKMKYVPYFELTSTSSDLGIRHIETVLEDGVIVKEVSFILYSGVIPEHNRHCKPGYEVQVGDRIMGVSQAQAGDRIINTICIQRTAHFDGSTFTQDADGDAHE